MSITIPESPLENRIAQLEIENKRLHDTVAYLTRQLYGRSSEKTTALFDGQLSLFDEAEIEAKKKAPEPDLKDVESYRRKTFKGQREKLLENLPHTKRLCTLVDEKRFCEICETPLESDGEEFVPT